MSNPPRMLVVPPGAGEQHWQPQPANGWIEVLTSPRLAGGSAGFSAGLQELPQLGKIREHAHPAQTEVLWVIAGQALARLDGVVRRIVAGTFLVVPPHVRHGFINDCAATALMAGKRHEQMAGRVEPEGGVPRPS